MTARQRQVFKQTRIFMTTSQIKMATNQTVSSVFPAPPLQEELRHLWSYNQQHRFKSNRSRFSRPDRHQPNPNLRQILIYRPDLHHSNRQDLNLRSDHNLRPDISVQPDMNLRPDRTLRQVQQQEVTLPRQPAQIPRPALNLPPPKEWIWVPS